MLKGLAMAGRGGGGWRVALAIFGLLAVLAVQLLVVSLLVTLSVCSCSELTYLPLATLGTVHKPWLEHSVARRSGLSAALTPLWAYNKFATLGWLWVLSLVLAC
jgi:hypothetical protein